jgi:hypothetical protein
MKMRALPLYTNSLPPRQVYGLFLQNSSGFLIEENTFHKSTGAPTGTYMGVAVNNCPCEEDEIYKNTFKNLN